MRPKCWLLGFLFIGIFNTLFSQSNSKSLLLGDWYMVNVNSLEKQDTLLFQRQLHGDTFNLWSFKLSEKLLVSRGSIRDNNPNAKCFASVLHYTWSILRNDGREVLRIYFGDKVNQYIIGYISEEKLMLVAL